MIRLLVILAILGLPSTSLARILSFDIEPKQILRFTSHNDGSSITVSASVADEFLKLTQNHVGQTVAVTIDGHPYAVFTIQTTYRAESFVATNCLKGSLNISITISGSPTQYTRVRSYTTAIDASHYKDETTHFWI